MTNNKNYKIVYIAISIIKCYNNNNNNMNVTKMKKRTEYYNKPVVGPL